mgnify:CR=1 FL=1
MGWEGVYIQVVQRPSASREPAREALGRALARAAAASAPERRAGAVRALEVDLAGTLTMVNHARE